MSEPVQKPALNEAFNGVKTPLYFDRQVVRASDLNLDRKSHDEELERMRRLLHGWGIVGGFDVLQNGDNLGVGRGYGITPTGEEVFLRERLDVTNLAEHIWACCGPGPIDCDLVDEVEIRRRAAANKITVVAGWLIARPTRTLDEPRPGVAEGCEHPANVLLPTRTCDGVRLELLCDLPPPHILTTPSCEELSRHICNQRKDRFQPFLAMPPAYGNDLSYLVLCLLISNIVESGLNVTMYPVNRKTLLPVSVLQQFLHACVCPVLIQPAPPVEDDTPPEEHEPDDGVVPIEFFIPEVSRIFIPEVPRIDWRKLEVKFKEEGLFGPRDLIDPDGGFTDPVPIREDLAFFADAEIVAKLDRVGVAGPIAFIETDAAVIAEATGLTISAVEKTKLALGEVRHLFDGPRF